MQVVFRLKYKKKNQSLSKLVLLAGALGLEPRTKVLEVNNPCEATISYK